MMKSESEPNDILRDVLEAVENKVHLRPPNVESPTISLISWKTFTKDSFAQVRLFQARIRDMFGVDLSVIGGGYGCTRIVFEVQAKTPEEATKFILEIMKSSEFKQVAKDAEFRVLISHGPYYRSDLRTGDLELGQDARNCINHINIGELVMGDKTSKNITNFKGDVRDSILAVDSANSTLQLSHQLQSDELFKLLELIRAGITADTRLSESEKSNAIEIVEALDNETSSDSPRLPLLKSYADTLKSISSIGESVSNLLPLLGLGA